MSSLSQAVYESPIWDQIGHWTEEPAFSSFRRHANRPRMDLHVDPDGANVTATIELPGVKPDDVKIEFHQDRLTVSGETSASEQREERGYKVRERSAGKYSRTLTLPQGTKPNEVHAKMENGLLNITFPKGQAQQPQRITIEQ